MEAQDETGAPQDARRARSPRPCALPRDRPPRPAPLPRPALEPEEETSSPEGRQEAEGGELVGAGVSRRRRSRSDSISWTRWSVRARCAAKATRCSSSGDSPGGGAAAPGGGAGACRSAPGRPRAEPTRSSSPPSGPVPRREYAALAPVRGSSCRASAARCPGGSPPGQPEEAVADSSAAPRATQVKGDAVGAERRGDPVEDRTEPTGAELVGGDVVGVELFRDLLLQSRGDASAP